MAKNTFTPAQVAGIISETTGHKDMGYLLSFDRERAAVILRIPLGTGECVIHLGRPYTVSPGDITILPPEAGSRDWVRITNQLFWTEPSFSLELPEGNALYLQEKILDKMSHTIEYATARHQHIQPYQLRTLDECTRLLQWLYGMESMAGKGEKGQ